jgi:hypothetical protein
MKHCPQCNRVESDEALKYCRVDGAMLVTESSRLADEAGTTQLASDASEVHTSILPNRTNANTDRQTTATIADPQQPASVKTRNPGESRQRRNIFIGVVVLIVALLGIVFAFRQFVFVPRFAVAHFADMKIMRVTTEGNVDSVTGRRCAPHWLDTPILLCRPLRGLTIIPGVVSPGLTPQALCCRLLRRL